MLVGGCWLCVALKKILTQNHNKIIMCVLKKKRIVVGTWKQWFCYQCYCGVGDSIRSAGGLVKKKEKLWGPTKLGTAGK